MNDAAICQEFLFMTKIQIQLAFSHVVTLDEPHDRIDVSGGVGHGCGPEMARNERVNVVRVN